MRRIVLRWLNPPAFVILVAIGVALQTSLFASYPLMYLQPDVVLIAVIWAALRRSFIEGGILTLIFGNIAEIHSSSPQGLFMIVYMSVYLLSRGTAKLLVLPNLSALVILTLGASLFWKFEYLGILHLMGQSANQWRHMLVLLLPGAVMEGVTAIWVFRWLDRFDWVTFKSPRAAQQMEDELQLEGEGL